MGKKILIFSIFLINLSSCGLKKPLQDPPINGSFMRFSK